MSKVCERERGKEGGMDGGMEERERESCLALDLYRILSVKISE